MLVLTRRSGEAIVIDGDIHITVVAVKGDRVRLGITAPETVCVDRKEVHDRRVALAPDSLLEPVGEATGRLAR